MAYQADCQVSDWRRELITRHRSRGLIPRFGVLYSPHSRHKAAGPGQAGHEKLSAGLPEGGSAYAFVGVISTAADGARVGGWGQWGGCLIRSAAFSP